MSPLETANLFFVPSGILIGALSVGLTEPLKTFVSIIGAVAAVLWLACALDANTDAQTRRERLLRVLPVLFLVGWIISVGVHGYRWSQGL